MRSSSRKISTLHISATAIIALMASLGVAPAVQASPLTISASVLASKNGAEDAPPSKYIKKVTETRTTVALNLRKSASTSSESLGVMPNGATVKLTGKTSGSWKQLVWSNKTGWAAGEYLTTKTFTKDESVRYLKGYATIYATPDLKSRVGDVNFRTQVSLLEVKGSSSHIKTAYFHGWVASSSLSTQRAGKQYRYVQKSGAIYSHYDPKASKTVGRIHEGEKYEHRRWMSSSRRDEILVNGKWVWTSVTNRAKVAVKTRYAQSTGNVYSAANRKTAKVSGTIRRGTAVAWGAWDSKNKRDEVKLNGRWVWTDVTNRSKPKTEIRYAQKNGTLYDRADRKTAKKVGTIKAGAKVEWATWNSKNRRDEVKVNGRWVWTDVTNRKKPAGYIPPVVNISDYARFTTKNLTLRKDPSTSAKSSGSVNKGMKVTVTHKAEGGWVKVKTNSVSGFIKESDNLRLHGPYSVAVYGTLRSGQSAYNVMAGFQQKVMDQRISNTSLYQLWNRNWTFLTNGSKSVVAEQFQYSDSKGPSMLKKLDKYESQLKYQGKPMYTRQKVRMTDGSQSWTYKTTPFSEKVVKNSGRYISSGDFLKRS